MIKATGLFLAIMLWAGSALALPSSETGAPESLAAWQSWVLYGHEDQYLCPEVEGEPQCLWPVVLSLRLNDEGGAFTMTVELKNEGEVTLPGGAGAWPEAKSADGQPLAVLGTDRPVVWLSAGRHTLSGRYHWPLLPETIDLPLGFVLDIQVNERPLYFPAMEVDYNQSSARLWLKKKEEATAETADGADNLTVTVNRLIQDTQPMIIKSRFRLAVSGRPREVVLDNALLPDTMATFLSSPLPSQLTPEGLRVQVKPGIYEIFIDSRSLNRSETLGPVSANSNMDEYWAFQAHPELRLAEISGADQIDASQADIYDPWRSFPIYAMTPGSSLKFDTLRRGDPEPAPDQLNLRRECWLDYNGQGLTCRDYLTGTMSRQWHLNTTLPFILTQASLSGQPQVITWQTNSKGEMAAGLQLREGHLNLKADLRIYNFDGTFPASGWDHKLESKGQILNLPPGYRLLHVSGADTGSRYYDSTWTGSWRALDFFIILIITVAMVRLYGPPLAAVALVALILCFHEPGSPKLIFLPLLACAALLPLLPQTGKIAWLMRAIRNSSALILVILSTLFLIGQARGVIYPQLGSYMISDWSFPAMGAAPVSYVSQDETYDGEDERYAASYQTPEVVADAIMQEPVMAGRSREAKPAPPSPAKAKMASAANSMAANMVRLSQAPDAKVQNSAPRPAWKWASATLFFNDSVTAEQEVKLYLVGPTLNRILGILRIMFMTALSLAILGAWQPGRKMGLSFKRKFSRSTAAMIMAATLGMMSPSLALAQGSFAPIQETGIFPGQKLLEEYRERLLQRKQMPSPAISQMRLEAGADKLTLEINVSAGEMSVLALPTLDRDIFRLERLTLVKQDNTSTDGSNLPLIEAQGRWLTLVPPGTSLITIEGRLKKASAAFQGFQINFPADGRPLKVLTGNSRFWKTEGLEEDGQLVTDALYLSSADLTTSNGQSGEESSTSVILDPFFMVERTISLGLEWKVYTTVSRLTPSGGPVSLKLPLLPGEHPITGGLRRDGELVTINFAPQAESLTWESSLDITPNLELVASEGPWTESWLLDVSPIWRAEPKGLMPIHNLNQGFWQPQWRPWPGEKLSLTIDRPQAVPGKFLVIDKAKMSIQAGEHNQLINLSFLVRTSQGGPYSFSLPPGAEIRNFTVDGKSVPLAPVATEQSEKNDGKEVAPTLTAPLTSGDHEVQVTWTIEQPFSSVISTPALNLGVPTANISISLILPENRWIVWAWGPLQGPAVQFWPLLAIVLIAALILRRTGKTPLNGADWFLLGIGLIQLNIIGAMVVAGWLLMLGRREKKPAVGYLKFNFGQIFIAIWTITALWLIYKGIENGLLENPDMLIAGGGSYGQHLIWFYDQSQGPWPTGSALTLSSMVYRALMLGWSLWLAVSLIKWLKWGWASFTVEGLWKKRLKKGRNVASTQTESTIQAEIDPSPEIIDKPS